MLKPYMSYRINFIGNLIYLVEFMARLNSVKPILNNDVILNGIYITYLNYYSSSISADNIKNQSLFIMFL